MKQVYVHGLGQTPSSWEPVLHLVPTLEDGVCPDLAGILPAGEATYSNLYHAFAQFCDGMDASLALCGLSLGGVLALHYAATHPKQVGALVLIAPQYRMPKQLLRMQNALFRWMPQSMFGQTGFTKAQFIKLCGSMADLDLSGGVHRISCPTLIVCGSRDRANKRACMSLAELLPQAELRIVEGAGHELNREVPEKLAPLIWDFYARSQL